MRNPLVASALSFPPRAIRMAGPPARLMSPASRPSIPIGDEFGRPDRSSPSSPISTRSRLTTSDVATRHFRPEDIRLFGGPIILMARPISTRARLTITDTPTLTSIRNIVTIFVPEVLTRPCHQDGRSAGQTDVPRQPAIDTHR